MRQVIGAGALGRPGRGEWIKDRNGKDLTKAEEIRKRWQEYTEELS